MADQGSGSRLAYVGPGGQLHVMEVAPSGATSSRQLTWSVEPTHMASWGGVGGGTTASWPCWSPDGRSIACFVDASDDAPQTLVAVMEVDGVHEQRLSPLTDRMPIHLQWSPDGARLGVLVQFEDQLELWVAEVRPEPRPLRLIAEGSPLFFGWACGGDRVLLHVGDGGDGPARVEVRDVAGDEDDIVFRVPPSNFCVPYSVRCEGQERVLYVIRRDQASQVVSAALDGEDVLGLAVLPGLVALVPAPEGTTVAVASAPDADGSPYAGIRAVSCDGLTRPRSLVDGPVLAFFWGPEPGRPMWVQWDTARTFIEWWVPTPDGEVRAVGQFRPTRDQYFHFHFFEQFARSHPPVSADGRWLTWSGHAPDHHGNQPAVYLIDLHAPSQPPVPVCPGSYAVFAPA